MIQDKQIKTELPIIEKLRPLLEIEQNAKNVFCTTVNFIHIYQNEKLDVKNINEEIEQIKKLMIEINEQYAIINKKISEEYKEQKTETAN